MSRPRNSPSGSRPWIVWLRDDLRLSDQPALDAAAKRGPVLPVCVFDERSPRRALGAAARWWLRASLSSLRSELSARGGSLIVRRGRVRAVLRELVDASNAAGVCTTRAYDAPGRLEQDSVAAALAGRADFELLPGNVLIEPGELLTKSATPYRVFTPFWKALRERLGTGRQVQPASAKIDWSSDAAGDASGGVPGDAARSEPAGDIEVPAERYGWTGGLAQNWQPGTQFARRRLEDFVDSALATYSHDRDVPGIAGTSRLSPHLRFGEIGIRQVWDAVAAMRGAASNVAADQCEAWLRELGWREFCRHLLFHFPDIETANFRREYDDFDWRTNADDLRAWQRGRTGYPLVDAGMRELWQTGWMHNRVRMVTASFLSKHLRIHWRAGEAWFRDTLVDADDASNCVNWQWAAGTGPDAAPYFRIFNPTTQAKKFDAHGRYIRRWLPQLAHLNDTSLHEPWRAGPEELAAAGIRLGRTYPAPIVEHAAARTAALAAYAAMR